MAKKKHKNRDKASIKENQVKELLKEANDLHFIESHPDVVVGPLEKFWESDSDIRKNGNSSSDISDLRSTSTYKAPVENLHDISDISRPLYSSSKRWVIGFDEIYATIFSPLINLYGEEHNSAKKLMLYSILSNSLKANFIEDIGHDMRINAFVCLDPGSGKHELKKGVILSQIEGIDRFIEPVSFHPEQLVGKNSWDNKRKELLDVPGYLEEDLLIIDEAKDLYKSDVHEASRKYIRKALDPIGYNNITKGSVDLPEEHRKHYYSKSVLISFFQPQLYKDELITEGDLRRGICIIYEINSDERMEALRKKLRKKFSKMKHVKRIERWHDFLKHLRSRTYKWDLSLIRETVDIYTEKIQRYSKFRGINTAKVASIMVFDIAYQLIRMSCIRSACDGTQTPEPKHLDLAFKDYKDMWKKFLDFITTCLPGNFSISSVKIPVQTQNRMSQSITWLAEQGAIGPDITSTTSRDFIDWCVDEQKWWNSKNAGGGAWSLYSKLVEMGILESRRESRGVKIWVRIDKLDAKHQLEEEGML